MNAKDISRFWKHVDKSGECWIWKGDLRDGYGRFKVGGRKYKTFQAHRVAWELEHGPIPEGFSVLHDCPGGDVRACVRHSHLWLGTIGQNNTDRHFKGKDAKGKRNGRSTHPETTAVGERNGKAKLTSDFARQIFHAFVNSSWTGPELARIFGITPNTVYSIVKRKTWKAATRALW